VYNLSFIKFYRRPDDGLQLQAKHVAVNKLIKTGVVCDTGSCNLLTSSGMLHLQINPYPTNVENSVSS